MKGKELLMTDTRKPQDYFTYSSLVEARIAFRIQNRMLDSGYAGGHEGEVRGEDGL